MEPVATAGWILGILGTLNLLACVGLAALEVLTVD